MPPTLEVTEEAPALRTPLLAHLLLLRQGLTGRRSRGKRAAAEEESRANQREDPNAAHASTSSQE